MPLLIYICTCILNVSICLQKSFNRGIPRSLWVGLLIALPSGAGAALSVLGGNQGSLVGVAISASLLPPAVNAVSTFIVQYRVCARYHAQS